MLSAAALAPSGPASVAAVSVAAVSVAAVSAAAVSAAAVSDWGVPAAEESPAASVVLPQATSAARNFEKKNWRN